jgi:ketosteroid isomerase-like protein
VRVDANSGRRRRGISAFRIAALVLSTLSAPRADADGRGSPPPHESPRVGKEDAVAEAAIRRRVEDLAKAVGAKDLDGVMSFYAPNIVSFDIGPPLRYVGTDNKRRAWHDVFATYPRALRYEIGELSVTTDGALAFVHSVNHVKGALANGHVTDMWVRWTACFRRIDGVWRIVHDHVSVPADLENGRALVNLTP